MSHQFTYFLTPDDFLELEQRLRAIAPLVILDRRSAEPTPNILPSSDTLEDGRPRLRLALARVEDVKEIQFSCVLTQNYWSMDTIRSPVIEYGRCFFDGQELREARMYYTDGFWSEKDTWIPKSEGFRKWAKSVFATTKRMLKRRGAEYIGPHAQAWVDAGGQLTNSFGRPC